MTIYSNISDFFNILKMVGQVRTFSFLLILMVFSAFLEILGIGSAIPILQMVLSKGNEDLVIRGFLFNPNILLVGIFGVFIVKNILNLIVLIFQARLLQKLRHMICIRLFSTYLHMPYLAYLEKHTSHFIFLCFSQVNEFVHSYGTALCTLVSELIVEELKKH